MCSSPYAPNAPSAAPGAPGNRSAEPGSPRVSALVPPQLPAHALAPDVEKNLNTRQNNQNPASAAQPRPCAYCGVNDPAAMVRCAACDRWFCNNAAHRAGSHLITHLVLLRHLAVCLPPNLPLGAEALECYTCGGRNLFVLGYVAAKHALVMVLLCRTPCAQLRDINWDTNAWQPLVCDRRLVLWVVPPPDPAAAAAARRISYEAIAAVEAQWRVRRNASVDDVVAVEPRAALAPVLLRYPDAICYHNTWAPLIAAEAACDRAAKESHAVAVRNVEWGLTTGGRPTARFAWAENEGAMVSVGEEMRLHVADSVRAGNALAAAALAAAGASMAAVLGATGPAAPWTSCGVVIARSDLSVTLELDSTPPPTAASASFIAEVVWRGVSYERMQRALREFATQPESVLAYLFHRLLGHDVEPVVFAAPTNLGAPGLPALNASQLAAARAALSQPLTLIQGPPGTGKTATCTSIVYHATRMHRHRVLVCAPSNVAVDHLADKLNAAGVRVVRVLARLRDDWEAAASPLLLRQQTMDRALKSLRRLAEREAAGEQLTSAELKTFRKQWPAIEHSILSAAQVVCCTCVGAGDVRLKGLHFRTVVVDESTQAGEPEAFVPIVHGAKQLVLVGDHKQLGPVIVDAAAARAGLHQLLFERMLCLGEAPHRLDVQYRMHPALATFLSNMFYDGALQNGVGAADRQRPGARFPWPVAAAPMMFWACYGREELGALGLSYLNRAEALNVEKVVARLMADGVEASEIGVITPYEGQRAYIVQHMRVAAPDAAAYAEVEVASVDAFQGREKDYVVLLCVRASDSRSIGFLSDARRMNVALTRARFGMVVLGNPRALSKNRLWNSLLTHYRERGCLVEGPLDNLLLLMVPLGLARHGGIQDGQEQNGSRLFGSGMRLGIGQNAKGLAGINFNGAGLTGRNVPSDYANTPSATLTIPASGETRFDQNSGTAGNVGITDQGNFARLNSGGLGNVANFVQQNSAYGTDLSSLSSMASNSYLSTGPDLDQSSGFNHSGNKGTNRTTAQTGARPLLDADINLRSIATAFASGLSL